jgi:hypothetical protein
MEPPSANFHGSPANFYLLEATAIKEPSKVALKWLPGRRSAAFALYNGLSLK